MTVTAQDERPLVAFECTESFDASCRTYPAPEKEHHYDRCWISTWFELPETCEYVGDDQIDSGQGCGNLPNRSRSGEISAFYSDEFIEWYFIDAPASADDKAEPAGDAK